MSVQSNFKTRTSRRVGNDAVTDLNIYVDKLPQNSAGYKVLEPESSTKYELIYHSSIVGTPGEAGYLVCPASNGRGLSLTATTRTTVTANIKTHGAGVIVIEAPDHYTINLKGDTDSANTWSGEQTFEDIKITQEITIPVYADATARDAGITSPENGMECYLTDEGKFYDYTAGSWVARESGGTFPNASETVAGKTEMATDAQVISGTATGETGAPLVVPNGTSSIISTSAGAADAGKIPRLNALGQVDTTMAPAAGEVDTPYTAGEDVSLGGIAAKNSVNDEAITAIINTFSEPGTESEFSNGVTTLGTINHSACYLSDDKVAVFYEEESGTDALYARIGDIDGKTITWGTPQLIASATGGGSITDMRSQMIAVDSSTLAVAYRDTGNTHSQVVMGSVSGTTITWGTAVDILDAGGGIYAMYPQVAKVADGTLAVVYRSEQAPNAGYVGAIDYTGTTLGTFGTHVLFEAGDISAYSQIIGVDTNKGVIAYVDSDDGDKGKAILFTTAGTVVSVASPVQYDAGSCSAVMMDFVDTNTVIVSYYVGGVIYAVIGQVSGLTLTFGSANTIYSSGNNDPQVRMLTTTTGVVYLEDSGSNVGTFMLIDVSGTTVTTGGAYTTNSSASVEDTFVCKATDNKHVCFYRDTADSNKGNCEVYWNVDTSDAIIGFFTADALSAATVNVRSKGLITNPGWALTAGEVYWFDESGPTLVNTSGIKLGVAYDATSIDIDIDIDKSRYLAGPGAEAASKPQVTLMPLNNDYFTLSAGTQTSYGTHAKFTHTSAATTITVFPISMAKAGKAAGNGVTFESSSMSKIICEWTQSFSAAVGNAAGLGFGLVSSAAPLDDYDDTAASVNFAIDGSDNLYAHTANGSTHNETAIAGITLTNNNVYRIEYEYNSAARFYINGTLVATISSALPTSGAIYWGSGCDANDTIRFGQMATSVE